MPGAPRTWRTSSARAPRRLDRVGAGMHELAVQSLDHIRVVQDHLRDKRPRLQVTTPLALEEVALRADHRAALEQFGQIRHVVLLSQARAWRVQPMLLRTYATGVAPA